MAPVDPVSKYAQDVVRGRIPACELVRLACQRHLRLLKSGAKEGIRFDPEAAGRALRFFDFCRHVKGEWAGRRLGLEPWQEFIVGSIFGWKRRDGTRLIRSSYVEVPRKNGKTTLAAGIALYLLIADGEPGAEVYCAATKRDQAKLVFDQAKEMVRRSPALKRRVRVLQNNLHVMATASKLEPLGADKDTMDGLNVHGVVIDELHAHKDRGIWDVLTSATGARRQPLVFTITTAGLGGSPTVCRQEHDYSEQVLKGVVEDDSRFAFIATIDEGDDWTSPIAWKKANPNLGISIKEEFLAKELEKALAVPAEQNKFRRYYLNEWVQQESRYIDLRAWDACAGIVRQDKLTGRLCYGGLDLANKIDLAALVLLFPPEAGEDYYTVLPIFWAPEEAIVERSRRDRVPYDAWARQGFLRVTPGQVIDYNQIKADILALTQRYNLWRIGYDPWSAHQMAQELELEGLQLIEVRPGMKSMTEPTKELLRLVMERRIRHGGHPVLRWNADNLVVKRGPTDLIMPDKEKSREKIDGMVALITALALALRFENQDKASSEGVYFL